MKGRRLIRASPSCPTARWVASSKRVAQVPTSTSSLRGFRYPGWKSRRAFAHRLDDRFTTPRNLTSEHESSWTSEVSRETKRFDALRRRKKLYRYACATCHGKYGGGDGPSAEPLDPEPTDFTLGIYEGNDLFEIISDGIQHTAMPSYRKLLSEDDR